MANKQQTALSWFAERIQSDKIFSFDVVLQQALQMEREQIEQAYGDGLNTHRTNFCNRVEYYDKTYSFPETTPAMRELTEQEADILEQTFNNYCKSKNNHSLPDGKPE